MQTILTCVTPASQMQVSRIRLLNILDNEPYLYFTLQLSFEETILREDHAVVVGFLQDFFDSFLFFCNLAA